MNKVQDKRVVSKKAARDRRILAKARRENGAEKPLPKGRIEAAAARAGIESQPDPDVQGMGPAEWDKAVAHAVSEGGPLHGELVQLARRFESDGSGVGHGMATSLIVLGIAARSARSCLEVQLIAKRWLDQLSGVVIDGRIERANAASALAAGGVS